MERMEGRMKTIYVAGPMRNRKFYNFPAFDKARDTLIEKGWKVISPADIDRENGFDETKDVFTEEMLPKVAMRDVEAIINHCDAIYMLSGWAESRGARAEKALAEWMGCEVLYEEPEAILDEAKRLVCGDRQASYGPPDQDFQRTAKMWEALLGVYIKNGVLVIPPKAVAMCMIALKLSRETHMKKRDNAVDIAGYAHCLDVCVQCEKD
jgi:hypothetical protein